MLLGPVLGIAVAWWMFPDSEFPVYVIAAFAGAYNLFQTLLKCEFIQQECCSE